MSEGILDRNIVYASNIHGRQLKYKDNNYKEINETIQINLINKKITEKEIREIYYLKNEEGKILTKKLRIDIVDMVKGKEKCYTKEETNLSRWCKILTSKTEEEIKKAIDGGIMEKEAKEKLIEEVNKYSSDEEVIALYSAYTKDELEHNTQLIEAREAGINEGIKKRNLEIAKNLLNRNIKIDDIIDITGLSKEEIQIIIK